MKAAFTYYPEGKDEVTVWFDLPVLPTRGSTIHFHDRAWLITYVALVPDSEEETTPRDTAWHAECSVR